MIVDRKHIGWGIGTAIATLVASLLYLANNDPGTLKKWHISIPLPAWFGPVPPLSANVGGTPLGLVYGTLALLIFVFAALLGARRNHPTWPVGKIKAWLRAHIWLTIFTIPLVLLHCGFHGGGPMTQFLMWLYALVMASGFWGLFLQNVVPRLMRTQLSREVIFEQIPYIRSQLIEKASAIRRDFPTEPEENETRDHAAVVAAAVAATPSVTTAAALRFIDEDLLPYLKAESPRYSALRTKASSDHQFRLLRLQSPAFTHAAFDQLQEVCDEKRGLDLQVRLHYWLHGWVIVHAPTSLLLVVLTIVHAVVAGFLYD